MMRRILILTVIALMLAVMSTATAFASHHSNAGGNGGGWGQSSYDWKGNDGVYGFACGKQGTDHCD